MNYNFSMVNFILGFLIVDLFFSIILYFKKDIILNLNKNYFLFSAIVDILFLVILLFLKYNGKQTRKS